MALRRSRLTTSRTVTSALVVRVVPYGEADAIVTYLTEDLGKVAALGRGARGSKRRLAGALESMHTHRITLDERPGAELATLVESQIERPRLRLASCLDRLDAAGRALRWARSGSAPRTREPYVWSELLDLLDRLDDEREVSPPLMHLAGTGLRLLALFGYGLDFEACVRCGKRRDAERAGYIAASAGGVVCRACGGASRRLEGATLSRLSRAATEGEILLPEDATIALALVEEALAAHAGVET